MRKGVSLTDSSYFCKQIETFLPKGQTKERFIRKDINKHKIPSLIWTVGIAGVGADWCDTVPAPLLF